MGKALRIVRAHVRKDCRDHRAVLIGVAVAIPVLTFLACWAVAEDVSRIADATRVFLGGACALTVLALSTELFAGEFRRDTIGFLRRIPGGLTAALASKPILYVLSCAATAVWAGLSLVAAARALGGSAAAEEVLTALTRDASESGLAGAVAAAGL